MLTSNIVVPATEIKVALYIPEGFNPAAFGTHGDYAAYVLSTINRRIVFEKLDPNGFVPLMSALLKRVLPKRDYRAILNRLIALGVIECDRSYQVGTKSKGYRLTTQFSGQTHRRYVPSDPSLTAKLLKLRQDLEAGIVLPVHRHLWKYLQQIDLSESLPDFGTNNRQAQAILDTDWFFSVCQFGNRVHTNVSNMKKEMRSYLRYQGQELSNLDIANSQPLFLGVAVLNHYLNAGQLQTSMNFTAEEAYYNSPEILYLYSNSKEREGEGTPLCGNITHESVFPIPEDLKRYLNICQKGILYEHLMEKSGTTAERDEFKKTFFQTLFGSIHLMNVLPLAAVVQEQFPTVMAVMKDVKKKDYNHMARLLQRTESSFVFNRVVRRLMQEHPEVFISTIHDSFVTTTEAVPVVERIVLQEFARLGLRPTLKKERLIPEEARKAG